MARYRVLFVSSHVVPYAVPVYRQLASHPRVEITVAYCSLQGAEAGFDPGFGMEVTWDLPMLEGYPWVSLPNRSWQPGVGRFLGLMNPGLWSLVKTGQFDVVLTHGQAYVSYWIAIVAAKTSGIPVIVATDATSWRSSDSHGWGWPSWLKRWLAPSFYRWLDVVYAPSSATIAFLRHMGVPADQIALCHYAVENERFAQGAARTDQRAIRAQWGIPEGAFVVLFCGRLVSRKRPGDLLEALEQVKQPSVWAVFAGEGRLRQALERQAACLGVAHRVRWLGFVNQSQLPSVYAASDVLVLPSEAEPWGLVVNEAMACGLPAVVSSAVGCRGDIIEPGVTGEVYPVGDCEALAGRLRRLFTDRHRLRHMGQAARTRIQRWSYAEHVEGLIDAIGRAVGRSGDRRRMPNVGATATLTAG